MEQTGQGSILFKSLAEILAEFQLMSPLQRSLIWRLAGEMSNHLIVAPITHASLEINNQELAINNLN